MERTPERIGIGAAWAASALLVFGLAILLGVVVVRGAGALGPRLLFGDAPVWHALTGRTPVLDGIWPAIVGTLALVALSSLIALGLGIATGIHLAEYAPRRVRDGLNLVFDVLAGVPSVVMGLFGFSMILLLRRTIAPDAGTGLLLSACCIALLVLPYLIRTTQIALVSLPSEIRLLGPSLGLTRVQNLRHVLLPSAGRGILSGAVLAIARAAEDTAVIMLTGAVASCGLPSGLLENFEALPFRIYVIAAEYRSEAELAQGFGCALVLFALTAGLLALAWRLQRGMEDRWSR